MTVEKYRSLSLVSKSSGRAGETGQAGDLMAANNQTGALLCLYRPEDLNLQTLDSFNSHPVSFLTSPELDHIMSDRPCVGLT